VRWERTAQARSFQASLSDYSAQISQHWIAYEDYEDNEIDGVEGYTLRIYDETGTLIDEVDNTDLDEGNKKRPFFALMREMYATARRIALGTDKALDAILSQLPTPEEEMPRGAPSGEMAE